jgi:negative regulator of flagellin synthesis FlgM
MKVSNKIGQNMQGIEAPKANKANKANAEKKADLKGTPLAARAGDTAKVNLSERAQSMQKAKEIASHDTVDEAKVARLQKLIDDGKYKVDARAVADRLVDEHLAMGEE